MPGGSVERLLSTYVGNGRGHVLGVGDCDPLLQGQTLEGGIRLDQLIVGQDRIDHVRWSVGDRNESLQPAVTTDQNQE